MDRIDTPAVLERRMSDQMRLAAMAESQAVRGVHERLADLYRDRVRLRILLAR